MASPSAVPGAAVPGLMVPGMPGTSGPAQVSEVLWSIPFARQLWSVTAARNS